MSEHPIYKGGSILPGFTGLVRRTTPASHIPQYPTPSPEVAVQQKPRISKLGWKRWMCRSVGNSAGQYGVGDNPAAAFWDWWARMVDEREAA